MKDKEINIYDYEKIVFVDASGDDGFSFRDTSGDGSSFSFVVSCFVINPEDFEYNCQVLKSMKDALHLPHTSELKSTTLRRHRFSKDAYKQLAHAKGNAFSIIAYKKVLQQSPDPIHKPLCDTSTKQLSGLVHAFPIFALTKTKILSEGSRVLVVIDHMKQTETESIEKVSHQLGINTLLNCDTIYRDSKSEKFPLIQLADVICGSVRNYFEKPVSEIPLQRFCQICKNKKAICTKGPALKAWNQNHFTDAEKTVLSLHRDTRIHNNIMVVSITTLPLHCYEKYLYIDCAFNGKHKKRS